MPSLREAWLSVLDELTSFVANNGAAVGWSEAWCLSQASNDGFDLVLVLRFSHQSEFLTVRTLSLRNSDLEVGEPIDQHLAFELFDDIVDGVAPSAHRGSVYFAGPLADHYHATWDVDLPLGQQWGGLTRLI